MRARLTLLAAIIVLSLTACSSGTEAFYLEGESQATAWFFTDGRLVEIEMDRSLVDGDLESLFGLEAVSHGVCTDEVYERRRLCYESIAAVTGYGDATTAWRRNHRTLEKSNFLDNIASLCPSFDEKGYAKRLEDVEEHYVYNLSEVLSHVDGEERESFIPLWLTAAL